MKKKGLTLTELAVMMTSAAFLTATAVPVLKQNKMDARKLLCRSNLQQWGIAVNAYANDNNDNLPRQDLPPCGMNAWDVSAALICFDDQGTFGFYRPAPGSPYQPCELYNYGINQKEFAYCPLMPAHVFEDPAVMYWMSPANAQSNFTRWFGYIWWVPRMSYGTLFPWDYPPTGTPPNYKISWPARTSGKGASTHPIITDCVIRLSTMNDLTDNPTAMNDLSRVMVNGLYPYEVYGTHIQNGVLADVNWLFADGHVQVNVNEGTNIHTRYQPSAGQYKNMY